MFFDIFISKEDILMLNQLMCQTKNPLRMTILLDIITLVIFLQKPKLNIVLWMKGTLKLLKPNKFDEFFSG
jgi:hypothetical protein